MNSLLQDRMQRVEAIHAAGGLEAAISSGRLGNNLTLTVSEAILLGLLRQQVRSYLTVFGHGSTDVAEVLRVYAQAGLVRCHAVRNEIEAAHAAAALRWVTGEKAAVVTSIGPGALQAFAGSLMAASDGLGVWFLVGDETTEDEGPNMQQIPGPRQHTFLRIFETMGGAYVLHTPNSLPTALRRGLNTVDHPHRGAPFFMLMPMNVQPQTITNFNPRELPREAPPAMGAAGDNGQYDAAVQAIQKAARVVVKCGGGARHAGQAIQEFLELTDAVAVTSPLVSGVIPFQHPRNMTVGGSKGSLSGNYAMEHADLLVVIGSRFVCQSDCSRTGYPNVKQVININTDMQSVLHYADTIALWGDAKETLQILNSKLQAQVSTIQVSDQSQWYRDCRAKRKEWDAFRQLRYDQPTLYDSVWRREVLTQPAAIKIASDWTRANNAVAFFDAGDVQANGFQIVEDDRTGRTFTDTGASYMGFAVSALLATGVATESFYAVAFTGDGSFFMNPQILIDGVAHKARGCILLLDNRRMAAISGLQQAQYHADYATWDHVAVDYVQLASAIDGVRALHGGYSVESLEAALAEAFAYAGLTLIHVPVYYGDHELGGMGVFGRWNVGNWVADTQRLRHTIGL